MGFRKRFLHDKLAVVGLAIVLAFFILSILTPYIAPYDPSTIDVDNILAAPTARHLFGTDDLGRDVFTRMLYGAGISLKVGFVAVGIATLIGILLGAVSGYYGGWIDIIIMRFVDIMLCFPSFFLILAVIAFLEPSIFNIMAVIGLTSWMGITRLVRAEFLSLKERDFVLAEKAMGAGGARIIFLHILPNAMAPVLVSATLGSRIGRARGIGAVLPGNRRPAAHPKLGQHPHPGPEHSRRRLVALVLPGHGHPHHRAGLQPPGRRHPRRNRSSAEKLKKVTLTLCLPLPSVAYGVSLCRLSRLVSFIYLYNQMDFLLKLCHCLV